MTANDQDYTPEDRERVEVMAAIWADVMSPGDRSTAVAIAFPDKTGQGADTRGTLRTTKGSPNDRFWSQMVALGWAEPRPENLEGFPNKESFAAFMLTRPGEEMLPKFLRAVSGANPA